MSVVWARWTPNLLAVMHNCRGNCWLFGAFAIQTVCVLLLVVDIAVAWLGDLTPMGSARVPEAREHRHAFAFFLLVILAVGTALSGLCLRKVKRRQKQSDGVLLDTARSFVNLIEQHFTQWKLTPSERHVALLAIRGMSIADIAELRQTKSGTIKSQCNAIYRKAGVSGRPQLISLFIEELLDDSAEATGNHETLAR